MDVGFEFLLPVEAKILAINFEQPIYEWQGEQFPQGPEEAWHHNFKLIKSDVPKHIIALLPKSWQNESWQCISVVDGIETLANRLSADTDISPDDSY